MLPQMLVKKSCCLLFILVLLSVITVLLVFYEFSLPRLLVTRKEILPFNEVIDNNVQNHPFEIVGKDGLSFQNDFLNRKLMHLVALTHRSLDPTTIKSFSHKDQENDTSIDFSYLLDELKTAVNVQNYFMHLSGCKEIEKIKMEEIWHESMYNTMHSAVLQNEKVLIEVTKADRDVLLSAKCGSADSDQSQQNMDRCLMLKNRRLLDEAILLMQLKHPNVVKLKGLCIQRKVSSEKHSASAHGVVLVKEAGNSLSLKYLKSSSWEQRLKCAFDFLGLAIYFSNSPLGSIRLDSWAPDNFIVSTKDGKSKLHNLHRPFYATEPSCRSDENCFVDGLNCGIQCNAKLCVGFNAKKNLYELNRSLLSPLLGYNVPQKWTNEVLKLLSDMKTLQLSISEVVVSLMRMLPSSHLGEKLAPQGMSHNDFEAVNPDILSMRKLPDGSQVDSWEQHESVISINEVNLDLKDAGQRPVGVVALDEIGSEDPIPVELPKQKKITDRFKTIENADYPGRHDYYCPRSKAEWGCVLSMPALEDAMQKCLDEAKCKAVVTIPHLRKEGWIIAILKSDNSNPVDHAGTTVYVRLEDDKPQAPSNIPVVVDLHTVSKKEDCINDITSIQSKERSASEAALMKSCGWSGETESDLVSLIKNSKVKDANTFTPSRGKLANGGQMNIMLDLDGKKHSALFIAKRGPDEFDISQLAVYQIDRMLGLYKSVPAVERVLTAEELSDAGFPVDIGGNQFDKFRPLKQADNSLMGVIVPQISGRITVQHYISVPRLSGITNAVTPFNKKQFDTIEYLILGFLTSIPIPSKGHQSTQGRLIHIKTEEAFRHQSSDYLSYLYHCQFPSRVISTLRYAEKQHCGLGNQISSRLFDSNSPKISEILKENIKTLLNLVDQCIAQFGQQVVLYETPT